MKHFTATTRTPVGPWPRRAPRHRRQRRTRFLDKVVAAMPFPVDAIHVDGGAEFKAEFEQACARTQRFRSLEPRRAFDAAELYGQCNRHHSRQPA